PARAGHGHAAGGSQALRRIAHRERGSAGYRSLPARAVAGPAGVGGAGAPGGHDLRAGRAWLLGHLGAAVFESESVVAARRHSAPCLLRSARTHGAAAARQATDRGTGADRLAEPARRRLPAQRSARALEGGAAFGLVPGPAALHAS